MKLTALIITMLLGSMYANAQLVLNEVSQGASGTKEYMEFVVIGTRTCADSTADLRNWIFDDNNGWISAGTGQGIAGGSMRFANISNWEKVPYGSIILVYNEGDKNSSITIPDDPTDANHDYVYIVPASSALIEKNTSAPPAGNSNAAFTYPTTGFASGGSWSTVGLANGGDGVVITNPANLSQAYFSFAFGIGSAATATVAKSNMAGAKNYYLSDGNYATAASWTLGNVPANESPGSPNSAANGTWINSMRILPPGSEPVTNINGCIKQGDVYSFNGNNLTAGGYYSATIVRPGNCDSIVNLYLVVAVEQPQTVSGCGSVVYNGNTYTASAVVRDTVQSLITSCDSIIHITNIEVNESPVTNINSCIKQGDVYSFNGNNLTAGGSYSATIVRPGLCDSIVNLYLVVAEEQVQNIDGCGSVVFNGNTYTSSTIIRDTIQSLITACDSVFRIANITVNQSPVNNITGCIKQGDVYSFNGSNLTAGGNYTANIVRTGLCDSIVNLYLVVGREQIQDISGCVSVSFNGNTYTSSTVVRDTVRSVVTGCDSIFHIANITVNAKPLVTVTPNAAICKGETKTLTASAAGATIQWLGFPAGNTIDVTPAANTTYTAVATNVNGCTDTGRVTIQVQDFQLNITVNPNPVTAGAQAGIQTQSSLPYTVIAWQPPVLFPNQTATSQVLLVDTTTTVTVIGTSQAGCRDTAKIVITVQFNNDDFYVPNAFTPNNDTKNDVFRAYGSTIASLEMTIFDQWGEKVFETKDKNEGWDGRYRGKRMPQGVYAYVVRAVMNNGTIINKKGAVNLIK